MKQEDTQLFQKPLDKQKKLLIKKIMIWVRQGFNSRNIGFHPFLLCASIKPGAQKRHTTLQSYPNAELWRCLSKLNQQDIKTEIQQEIQSKLDDVIKNYDVSIIKEFKIRVNNNFDFAYLYKETEKKKPQQNENLEVLDFQNLNHPNQQERDESESKSLVKQILLCNTKQGSIADFENSHYHKLSQFLEKVKPFINQSSIELNQFYQGVQTFLESQQTTPLKKMKLHQIGEAEQEEEKQDQNNIKFQKQNLQEQQQKQNLNFEQEEQFNHQSQQQRMNKFNKSPQQLLDELKLDALKTQPGLSFFLPNYDKMSPEEAEKVREIEANYYKELYFLKVLQPQDYNPKQILLIWRLYFEPQFKKPNNLLSLYQQQNIIKKE
ncbi:unnamed protein product (macronuclear) [Paramecium tetraurelia]|uniref:Uncharacterized protein n=1 Tax=Paramecium tetraurelia TaxID=5888 RepID=A0BQH4_PARTE|nr:uncharacterized protein GSPATT00031020001 [Paramecium tetraurelia]CAK60791.1 unnamed protein product [Paramecium tetraurelia]|eukprot:XP_001428189.1 hypothetical protein (macronuclear) [Paramecium tetraurelia strain d4-2]